MKHLEVRVAEPSEEAMVKQRRFRRKQQKRASVEAQLEEIARYIEPDDIGSFSPQNAYDPLDRPADDYIWDSDPEQARDDCVAVLETLITPAGKTWHRTKAKSDELNEDHETREYLEYANEIVHDAFYSKGANFVPSMQSTLKSAVQYGSGYIQTMPDFRTMTPRFEHIHIGEGYPTFSSSRVLTGFDRYFKLTAAEAAEMFEELPEEIVRDCEEYKRSPGTKDTEKRYAFIHSIEQRADYAPDAPGARGMEWTSACVSLDGGEATIVQPRGKQRERGYYTMPITACHYWPNSRKDYPRGPVGKLLPAIRVLNKYAEIDLFASQIAAQPPIWVPADDAFSINWEAGSIIRGGVGRDGKMRAHTLPSGDPRITPERIADLRQIIRNGLLGQWFNLLRDNPRMTAQEALLRMEQTFAHMAPPVGQIQRGFVAQLFDRTLDVCMQLGLIRRPMPEALRAAGGEYKLEFDSPITDAQRAEEGAGFVRVLGHLIDYQMKTGDRRAGNVVNPVRAFRRLFRNNATPEECLSSDDEIAQLEQQASAAAEREAGAKDAAALAPLITAANGVEPDTEAPQ